MPKRPAKSGYARLAQAEEEEEDQDNSDDDHPLTLSRESIDTHYAPIQPGGRPSMPQNSRSDGTNLADKQSRKSRRRRRNSAVDVKAINARLERWAEEIASKFKIKHRNRRNADNEMLEIHYSVFQPPEGVQPVTADELPQYMDHPEDRMSKMEFDDVVESIRVAIELGVHPKLISKGSSGSYFTRNPDGKTVAIFKPASEAPYASRNPKWTKWLHRNLLPFAFGRACLIPNLDYVSEAAAYVLDTRLQTNIVPHTDVVYFTSTAFHYDFWDRRAYYRKGKPLPAKAGSLQVFLKGYQDATEFLREHPWPDQAVNARPKSRGRRHWADQCRPGSSAYDDDEEDDEGMDEPGEREARRRRDFWTDKLQLSLREELEKLVILDYIMRNTDRGLDNWMIHIDQASQQASLVVDPPPERSRSPYQPQDSMSGPGIASDSHKENQPKPKVRVGAIDNSLSWPWKHPDAWRSFPFGWLFLPVSLIGQPFTQKSREHFLPLLTSKQWWMDTHAALRACFKKDADFQEKMFAKQMAIVKGQAWNVVETLKTPGHGPLELTRRARVCVWDDVVDIPTVVPMQASPMHSPDRMREASSRARRATRSVDETLDGDLAASTELDRSLLDLGQARGDGVPSSTKFSLSRASMSDHVAPPPSSPAAASRATKELRRSQRSLADRSRRARNVSFTGRPRAPSATADPGGDDDDYDYGDLGYSAAREMEGNRKKVIVERLETVKGKAPVFSWC